MTGDCGRWQAIFRLTAMFVLLAALVMVKDSA